MPRKSAALIATPSTSALEVRVITEVTRDIPKKPAPNFRSDQIVVTMDPLLKEAILAKARENSVPMTKVIRRLLREWVEGRVTVPVVGIQKKRALRAR
jgi:hypothetical protein